MTLIEDKILSSEVLPGARNSYFVRRTFENATDIIIVNPPTEELGWSRRFHKGLTEIDIVISESLLEPNSPNDPNVRWHKIVIDNPGEPFDGWLGFYAEVVTP